MITIITGQINSGKTTKLWDIFNDLQKGDGFISIKNMKHDKVIGYDVMHLSSGKRLPLVLREDCLIDEWNECCKIGPYSFSRKTVEYVEKQLRKLIKEKISPIFIDEIGPLELEDKCFHKIFSELVKKECDLFVTIREDSLNEVMKKYNIKNKSLIEVTRNF